MWREAKPRLQALAILLLAATGLAIYVGYPIFEAEQGRAAVSIHPIVTVLCGPLIALGLWQLVFGLRLPWRDAITRNMNRLGLTLFALGLAGGGGLFWWLECQLDVLGY